MKFRSVALLFVLTTPLPVTLLAAILEMNPPAEPDATKLTALVGARLIDGRGGPPVEDAIVVVRGSRILKTGSRSQIEVPEGAEVVDVRGLSLLPGLIDTHFHSRDTVETPITFELENGITSFRDPGHPFKYYLIPLLAKETLPRIFLCGGHLDGDPPVYPDQAIRVQDANHARKAVFDHVKRGASAIKVYFRLPLEHIAAACVAAEERGVLVTAHLELVDADAAIRAGVRGIEHVTSFGTILANREDAEYFKKEIQADSNARRHLRHWLWSRIDLNNNSRLRPLLDLVVETGTFISPTLAIYEARPGEKGSTEETVQGFRTMLQFIRFCQEAGARITVGSHTAAPFAERGKAFQREMELLVDAGMSPLEVITAATLNGARFFGIADRLGTIEAGKTADLILVAGDPSGDIGAMQNLKHVMLNGTWVVGGRP